MQGMCHLCSGHEYIIEVATFLFPNSHLMPKQIYTSLSPDVCPLSPTRAHHHHPQRDRRCHPAHPARSNRYLMQGSQPLPSLIPSPLRCSACLRSCTPWAHTRKKCGTCRRLASAVLCKGACVCSCNDWLQTPIQKTM